MDFPQFDYAVIGGDMRQTYLAGELARHQNRVTYYALMSPPPKSVYPDTSHVHASPSLEEACAQSRYVMAPIPFCKNKNTINQEILDSRLSASYLFSLLHDGHHLFGGAIPEDLSRSARKRGVRVHDLLTENSFALFNTIAVAEGAISEAISRSPLNLHKSTCCILGFGKCGSTLAQYLKGMFCSVHIFSDDSLECARASIIADCTGGVQCFRGHAGAFDFIFNTIPSLIMTKEILCSMKKSVTIIDIASAPGGLDYTAAKELDVKAVLCPGLPGKYAPLSSAKAIKATVDAILSRERQHPFIKE